MLLILLFLFYARTFIRVTTNNMVVFNSYIYCTFLCAC